MPGMVTVTDGREGAGWRRPEVLLLVLAAAMPLASSIWMAMLNNFASERAAFDGAAIGVLHSVREIPGLLAFSFIALLFVFREQVIAYLSLILLGLGVFATGYFPTYMGLLATTLALSVGFHYYETASQSLALQWTSRERAPLLLGRILSVMGIGSIAAFGLGWLALRFLGVDMETVFAAGGLATVAVTVAAWIAFPKYESAVRQRRGMVLRRRYWLYYALTFMTGARRQIFVVFATLLLVQKFGLSVDWMVLLFFANQALYSFVAPRIGRFVARVGERRSLTFEYCGVIGIFVGYASVDNVWIAAGLYVLDQMFFGMAMAIRTYFQKIADPADIAPSSGVSLSISHIAAVFIPVLYGILWLWSPEFVFLSGAVLAAVSLLLARMVPLDPGKGSETVPLFRPASAPAPMPAE